MANTYFKFKQFTINQDKTSMKVGTDGVLLGSWADCENAQRILDVGTGTGLIAIMLAQRSIAKIDAVEIDEDAFIQASDNVQGCKWHERISLEHAPFQEFYSSSDEKYDLIVSNPPYFINSFKPNCDKRNTARHTDTLPFGDLLNGVDKLLSSKGKFCVILPYVEGCVFIAEAAGKDFYCTKKVEVKPTFTKPTKRLLLEFQRNKTSLVNQTLIIETNQRHSFTDEYVTLTKEFYLHF